VVGGERSVVLSLFLLDLYVHAAGMCSPRRTKSMANTECSGQTKHTSSLSPIPFLLFFPFFMHTCKRLFFAVHLKPRSLAKRTPHQWVLLCMLMALARVVESGLRQVEGHEWVGFSVPTTIVSTLSGTLFHAAIAPLFMETWLILIVNACNSNHDAKTEARFKTTKKLNWCVTALALPTYGTQVQTL
jgi:hypothetical protein